LSSRLNSLLKKCEERAKWARRRWQGLKPDTHLMRLIGTSKLVPLLHNPFRRLFQQAVKPCPFESAGPGAAPTGLQSFLFAFPGLRSLTRICSPPRARRPAPRGPRPGLNSLPPSGRRFIGSAESVPFEGCPGAKANDVSPLVSEA
jgi:hypothetical protein